jgi:hypothetical protein
MSKITVTEFKQIIKEALLREGQFGWMTQDTGEQIPSWRNTKVCMFDNDGNKWTEHSYQGYGVFGGKDYFDLLAEMNGYDKDDVGKLKNEFDRPIDTLRQIGIEVAYGKLEPRNSKPVLFPALVKNADYNWKQHDFSKEAQSDPDQSWEPDETEYDDEY